MAASVKTSYTIPCSSAFRDAALALADRRRVNVGDLARSVLLVVPESEIAAYPDPGDPPPGDRETVTLKSGPQAGRPWRRKPRLQVRMSPGYTPVLLRQALAIALALEEGRVSVAVTTPRDARAEAEALLAAQHRARADIARELEAVQRALAEERHRAHRSLDAAEAEIARLRGLIEALVPASLPGGVTNRQDALYVMGFHPGQWPDREQVRARFRALVPVHHPDSGLGSHDRMSQLNQAMEVLRGR